MMKLYLTRKNGKLYYGIGKSFRFIYLVFAVVILIGAAAYFGENDTTNMVIPVIIIVLLLLAAGYQEQWEFDKESRSVTYRIGLIFLNRKKQFSFEDVESFELNHFKKGQKDIDSKIKSRANRLYTTFAVALLSGDILDIEIIRHKKSAGRTEHAASSIAQYCSLPLTQDMEITDDTES